MQNREQGLEQVLVPEGKCCIGVATYIFHFIECFVNSTTNQQQLKFVHQRERWAYRRNWFCEWSNKFHAWQSKEEFPSPEELQRQESRCFSEITGRVLWQVAFLAMLWNIWFEITKRNFKGLGRSAELGWLKCFHISTTRELCNCPLFHF